METIKLDLIPGKKMPSLHASQYDDGREHGIDLFENGVAYNLDGTETLTINERKGDDCICSLDIENTFAETNHIVFASTEQMCAVWGNNICELVIAKGEKTIGTLNFILEIEQSPTEGGIESESEIKNLERQIEAITEEVIGDNYYTAEETDEAIATAIEGKADTSYVDEELAKKADKSNTYTKSEVDTLIDNLPEPMIFKGTLGVGGTIQSLPTASASNEGWTYKVITDGTYAEQTAKVGDVFTSNGSEWVLIPSGDEDNDTWRAIKVEGVEVLGNGISSGAVDFVGSENIEVNFDGNGNKVGVKTKNIYTKEEVDDIVYNILPDDTASGSVANFETDLALPIKSLEVDVNAKQDLHGYDYPWPAGGGKNLIDNADFFSYSSWETDLVTVGDFPTSISNRGYALPTISGETYTISFGIDASNIPPYVYLCKSDGETSTRVAYITTGSLLFNRTYTFTADGSLYYLRSGSMSNESSFNTQIGKISYVQLEKGSTATEYAPYENICPIEGWSAITPDVNGTTEVINLGGTYYGGRFTQDKAGHRQFEVTYKRELLKNWIWTRNSTEYAFAYFSTTNVTDKANNKNFVCEIFANNNNYRANLSNDEIGVYNNTTELRRFCIRCDEATTTEELNTIIGDYAIIYELATPIIIDLPDGEPITTLVGTNNIFADTGDSAVEYKVSVEQYVSDH